MDDLNNRRSATLMERLSQTLRKDAHKGADKINTREISMKETENENNFTGDEIR